MVDTSKYIAHFSGWLIGIAFDRTLNEELPIESIWLSNSQEYIHLLQECLCLGSVHYQKIQRIFNQKIFTRPVQNINTHIF